MLGGFRVSWHSLFSLVALLVGSWMSFRCARYLVRDERVYPFAIAVVLGGLASARIAHVADNWPFYADRPEEIVAFWNGGLAVTGAPIGSALAGLVASRRLRLPVGFMFDISVIGIVLGEAIGRLGDIVNGEHHAVACGLPWCVRYTDPNTLGQSEHVHPVVAYDALIDLAIFAVLFALWRRWRGRTPEGRIFWLYLALYGGARALTSLLRVDPVVLAGLQEAQVLGIAYALVGTVMVVLLTRRARRVSSTTVT